MNVFHGAPGSDCPREISIFKVSRRLAALKASLGVDYTNHEIDPAEVELVWLHRIKHYKLVDI